MVMCAVPLVASVFTTDTGQSFASEALGPLSSEGSELEAYYY